MDIVTGGIASTPTADDWEIDLFEAARTTTAELSSALLRAVEASREITQKRREWIAREPGSGHSERSIVGADILCFDIDVADVSKKGAATVSAVGPEF